MHQSPSSLPPLFIGDRLVVYGVLKASENANEGDDNEVRLEGMLGNNEKVQHLVKFSAPPITVGHRGSALLHQLAAKSFIQEKQDGYSERNDVQKNEEAKYSTISISKSANVVSKFTSFVAVDKDTNQPVSGPLRKYFVPLSPACVPMPLTIMRSMAMPVGSFIGGDASPFQPTCSTYKPMPTEQCSLPPDLSSFMVTPRNSLICGGASPLQPTYSTLKPRRPVQYSLPPLYHASSCGPPPNKKGRFDSTGFKAVPEREAPTQRFNWILQEIHASSHRSLNDFPPGSGSILQKKKDSPPVVALVTLQKASGSWDLTDQLVSLCGTSRDALIKGCPKEIAVDTAEGKLLWATALALVLLMGNFLDQKDEWEMIAEKGSKWMKKHLPAGVKYENVLEAAATTVGVQVKLGQ